MAQNISRMCNNADFSLKPLEFQGCHRLYLVGYLMLQFIIEITAETSVDIKDLIPGRFGRP